MSALPRQRPTSVAVQHMAHLSRAARSRLLTARDLAPITATRAARSYRGGASASQTRRCTTRSCCSSRSSRLVGEVGIGKAAAAATGAAAAAAAAGAATGGFSTAWAALRLLPAPIFAPAQEKDEQKEGV